MSLVIQKETIAAGATFSKKVGSQHGALKFIARPTVEDDNISASSIVIQAKIETYQNCFPVGFTLADAARFSTYKGGVYVSGSKEVRVNYAIANGFSSDSVQYTFKNNHAHSIDITVYSHAFAPATFYNVIEHRQFSTEVRQSMKPFNLCLLQTNFNEIDIGYFNGGRHTVTPDELISLSLDQDVITSIGTTSVTGVYDDIQLDTTFVMLDNMPNLENNRPYEYIIVDRLEAEPSAESPAVSSYVLKSMPFLED